MRSLMLAIVSFLTFASTPVTAQMVTKKYLRKNKNAPTTHFGDSTIYARGIFVDSSIIYFGSSDGSIRSFNTETNKSTVLIKLGGKGETRDLERSNGVLFGMQSGDNGMITRVSKEGAIGFIEPKQWRGHFFDALDFNGDVGFLMGDPVDGFFTLIHSKDGGKTWNNCEGKVKAITGEAGFAASGSNVHVFNDSTYVFVSGGMRSNFYKTTDSGKSWSFVEIPYYPSETTGAYSMCFSDDKNGVIVGGNYKQPELKMNTTYYTHDGGETWYNSLQPPGGYRSCVFAYNDVFYSCGRNGIDISFNGEDWVPFAKGTYYSLNVCKDKLIATTTKGSFTSFNLVEK